MDPMSVSDYADDGIYKEVREHVQCGRNEK